MDKIRKDKNNNIFILFLVSLSLLPKRYFYFFSFDFYKKSLFNFVFHLWYKRSLFLLTFDFGLLPSALVVITCGTFLFQKYIIINQESY